MELAVGAFSARDRRRARETRPTWSWPDRVCFGQSLPFNFNVG